MVIKDLPKSLETISLSCPKLSITSEGDEEGDCYQSNLKSFKVYRTKIIGDSLLQLSSRYFPKLDQLILNQNNIMNLLSLPDQRLSLVKISAHSQCLKVTVGDNKTFYYGIPSTEIIHGAISYPYSNFAMHPVHKPSPVIDENTEYFHFQFKSVQNLVYNDHLLLV
jgi:hypothetical protein